jgi:predicted KAP-like P-loop ATPase
MAPGGRENHAAEFHVPLLSASAGMNNPIIVPFNPWWFPARTATKHFFDQFQASCSPAMPLKAVY